MPLLLVSSFILHYIEYEEDSEKNSEHDKLLVTIELHSLSFVLSGSRHPSSAYDSQQSAVCTTN
jgi:hypothetical protein